MEHHYFIHIIPPLLGFVYVVVSFAISLHGACISTEINRFSSLEFADIILHSGSSILLLYGQIPCHTSDICGSSPNLLLCSYSITLDHTWNNGLLSFLEGTSYHSCSPPGSPTGRNIGCLVITCPSISSLSTNTG